MISWNALHGLCQFEACTLKNVANVIATGNLKYHPWAEDLTIGPINGKVRPHPIITWATA